MTNDFDGKLRRIELVALQLPSTKLTSASYGYDGYSRLQTATDDLGAPAYSATYSYLDNSDLIGEILFKQGTALQATSTRSYDKMNRLESSVTTPAAVGERPVGSSYQYNNAGQRKRATLADGSYWVYEYDSLGQVRSGHKFWADGTPVAGQQFDYAFDTIGNRTSTKAGGDENGLNQRTSTYTPNRLNQYSSRTVPGKIDVMGVALPTATVTVEGNAPYRRNEYFRKEINVANTSTAVYEDIVVTATGETPVTRHEFVPQTPENYDDPATPSVNEGFDADGNQLRDGRWTYTWDAENRLIRMITRTPQGPQQQIDFAYDWQGRRITKKVVEGTSTPVDQKFLYDGWNLIAILSPQSAVLLSFLWGTDLSGSMQGAGGVGGLLAVKDVDSGVTSFAAFDGHGNVVGLVAASDGKLCAQYEYGPFGEVLRATGPMALANPFRFSTKFQDDETGLLYYGYRYYDPSTGRWPNRDPIGQRGGVNVYVFARNDPVGDIDFLGLLAASVHSIEYRGHGSAEKNGTTWQYVEVDSAIHGQVPLNVTDAKPAASVTATLDDGFNARIVAWTALSRDNGITALQMSTDLSGTIKACCPCPFKKVRANWSARAGLSGTAGNARAQFDNERPANTSWNRPSASRSGVKDKTLDSSYCATFAFVISQGWTDVSKTTPTTSTVRVQATFECID